MFGGCLCYFGTLFKLALESPVRKNGMQEVREHTQDSQDSRRRDNRIKARSRAVPSPSAVEK